MSFVDFLSLPMRIWSQYFELGQQALAAVF
jgi:hypothetical protein